MGARQRGGQRPDSSYDIPLIPFPSARRMFIPTPYNTFREETEAPAEVASDLIKQRPRWDMLYVAERQPSVLRSHESMATDLTNNHP